MPDKEHRTLIKGNSQMWPGDTPLNYQWFFHENDEIWLNDLILLSKISGSWALGHIGNIYDYLFHVSGMLKSKFLREKIFYYLRSGGTSLVDQWLRHWILNTKGPVLIPGQGIRFHMLQPRPEPGRPAHPRNTLAPFFWELHLRLCSLSALGCLVQKSHLCCRAWGLRVQPTGRWAKTNLVP